MHRHKNIASKLSVLLLVPCVAITLSACKDAKAPTLDDLGNTTLEADTQVSAQTQLPGSQDTAAQEAGENTVPALQGEQLIDNGLRAGVPSPINPDPDAVIPELSEEEKVEANNDRELAKKCTDGGGLYNSQQNQCFEPGSDGSADVNLQILDSDDENTVKSKNCINGGGTYNTEQGTCYENPKN